MSYPKCFVSEQPQQVSARARVDEVLECAEQGRVERVISVHERLEAVADGVNLDRALVLVRAVESTLVERLAGLADELESPGVV